jgi:hypothetical protein
MAPAAAVYVRLFEAGGERQVRRQEVLVRARHLAGLVGLPALPAGAVPTVTAIGTRLGMQGLFLAGLVERPPALPLLAVRAARGAVATSPDDGGTWLTLARAFLWLGRTTTEGSEYAYLPPLAQLRHVQTATALVQAVNWRPDLIGAHETLGLLFAERQHFDLALKHREIQLRLTRRAGRLPGEDAVAFRERLGRLEQIVEQVRRTVEDSENRFVVRSFNLAGKPLERARLAVQLGLTGKALDEVLLRSSPDLYGVEGLRLLLELLLSTGRAQEARDLLDRDEMRARPTALGLYELPFPHGDERLAYQFLAYDWFDLCQAVGAGDYERAAAAIARLQKRTEQAEAFGGPLRAGVEAQLASEVGLGAAPESLFLRAYQRQKREAITRLYVQNRFGLAERADLHVIEGMLLLERGLPGQAGEQFRRALQWYRKADHAPARPGEPLARRYLERIVAAQQ